MTSVPVVLVVDDDELVRDLVLVLLRQAGFVALPAADAAEAVACAAVYDVDLLLTDDALPDERGSALAAKLVARKPGLPVLFMSGRPECLVTREGLLGAGEVDVLAKPFTPDELLRRVRLALDQVR